LEKYIFGKNQIKKEELKFVVIVLLAFSFCLIFLTCGKNLKPYLPDFF
jgi:hypothetical protein